MGLDTKAYWLTDRQSQCDFDFDFDWQFSWKWEESPWSVMAEEDEMCQVLSCQGSEWSESSEVHEEEFLWVIVIYCDYEWL
jgi:hypothetical protein